MTLVVRAFAMCLAAGIVFCASAGMARSAPLRERAGPPVPHGEAGQVVLWQGEEVSIGPKGAADPNYSNLILAGMVAGTFGLFWCARRHAHNLFRAECPNEEAVDEVVDALIKNKSGASFAIVPRALPASPFTQQNDVTTLARQIEIAARASTRLSRTVGLIYFEPLGYAEYLERHGQEKAREAMRTLVSELRQSLRSSDHVAALGENRILICICLLSGLTDLESITRRMFSIVARLELTVAATQRAGLAIYPINGYSGGELIRAARKDFRLRTEARQERAA
jgi:hypothetical protein